MNVTIRTSINESEFSFDDLQPDETALGLIRNRVGLTGTKAVCGSGACGACTILVDGIPQCSCLLPAHHLDGRQIQTIEQHGPDNLHPVQRAFMACDGLQCGFCTPGFINEAIPFYQRWRAEHEDEKPDKEIIAQAMSGHLCRCGAYPGIYEAIQRVCAGEFEDPAQIAAPRVDALEKVTGAAVYTVDFRYENQLEGLILRSPYPHARVISIDAQEALAMDGVIAFADLTEGQPIMRHVGQPVAGVAAVNPRIAAVALAKIKVEYEVLPAVIGIDEAMSPDAPLVYPDRNRQTPIPSSAEGFTLPGSWQNNVRRSSLKLTSRRSGSARRKIEAARNDQSDNLIENTYRNAQQVHTTLEPHAAVAKWDGPQHLTVHASTQSVHALRKELAEHFDLNTEDVQVYSQHVGGGFGGKQGMYNEIKAAVALARFAQRPVRVVPSRLEEMSYTSLRPGGITKLAVLTDDSGAPEAIRMRAFADAGQAIGAGTAVLYGFMAPRTARDLEDNNVVNHTTPGTPFRGPDAPVGLWAVEQAIDEAAHRHNLSPVEIRRRWYPDHQIRQQLYDWVETIPQWANRGPVGGDGGRFRQGIGLATAAWLLIYNPDVQVSVQATPDGIVVSTATQDIGNGVRTVLAKAIEDTFGIERQDVILDIGRAAAPTGPISGGSQSTTSVYPTTVTAAQRVIENLVMQAETKCGLQDAQAVPGGIRHGGGFMAWSELLLQVDPVGFTEKRGAEAGPLGLRLNLSTAEEAGALGMRLGHAVTVTELEVDIRLGVIKPVHVWTNLAIGRIFVPTLARSQVHGGVIQGLSYALYEEKVYDRLTGHTLTANLEDYHISGIGDVPEIDVAFHEEGFEEIRGQGIGLAELCTVGVAASVGNAVFHATGWRPLATPIRAADLLAGMKSQTN